MNDHTTSSTTRPKSLVEHYLRLDPAERRRIFLSTREAAHEIGVAQRTLQNWIIEGKIDAVRVGGRYMVHASSLEQYVHATNGGPAAEDGGLPGGLAAERHALAREAASRGTSGPRR